MVSTHPILSLDCADSEISISSGHYVENIGNTTLKYLEAFNSGMFQLFFLTMTRRLTGFFVAVVEDVSLSQVRR
jgi:hypothetical protein